MKKTGSIEKALKKYARSNRKIVRVGFIDDATYPDGTPVANVAFWNEYGATINVSAHEQTIYRHVNKNGDFNRNGKFVKKEGSNFATTHFVGAHTIEIPARPYFRSTIANKRAEWVKGLVKLATIHPEGQALNLIGEKMKDDFVESINNWSDPPNAPSTIKKKGFNAPLRDTMQMARSISYEVDDES